MNESDYLKATNRAKVSTALVIIRDVLPGKNWGISRIERGKIIKLLADAESKLFGSYELKE